MRLICDLMLAIRAERGGRPRRARTIARRLEAQTSPGRRRTAVNTAIFSAATGLSRVAGLIREVVAASYFGTSGAASAFTLAFQIPNLIRALVADAALSSAFVPVFSDLLEHKRRKEAYLLASALAGLLLIALGAISLLFILLAPVLIPLFTGPEFTPALDDLCVGLSQVLFPIVVLLGLNGLAVGILNAHDHFTIPAIAPLVWNMVIIAGMIGFAPLFEGPNKIYAYAIGVVLGTLVQLAMMIPALRAIGFPVFRIRLPSRGDPRVRQVLMLMLPVSVGLGLINIDLVLNSTIGSLVSDQAPRAIDAAFRIYMLPQGMFSVAVATVLFPQLSRLASRGDFAGLQALTGVGARQIGLLLIPSAAAIACWRRRSCGSSTSAASSTRNRPRWCPRRCSCSPSACRSAAGTCCSRARSSRSSGRGCRPRWPACRWSSTRPSRSPCTSPWASPAWSSAP